MAPTFQHLNVVYLESLPYSLAFPLTPEQKATALAAVARVVKGTSHLPAIINTDGNCARRIGRIENSEISAHVQHKTTALVSLGRVTKISSNVAASVDRSHKRIRCVGRIEYRYISAPVPHKAANLATMPLIDQVSGNVTASIDP